MQPTTCDTLLAAHITPNFPHDVYLRPQQSNKDSEARTELIYKNKSTRGHSKRLFRILVA